MTRKTDQVADAGDPKPNDNADSTMPVRTAEPAVNPLQAEAVRQSGVRTRFDAGRYRRKQNT
jgi:hypothetical protein